MEEATPPPFFSIIMPVYNHEQFVGAAIDSVLAQSFRDWELVIVDDGSKDKSDVIIDSYSGKDPRIVAIHQSNGGEAAARNRALRACRANWITFLDSDDLWYPHTLQAYAEFIAAHPEATFLHGYRHRLNADGSITQSPGEFQERVTGAVELFGRMFLSCLCVCFKKELAERVGGYDQSLPISPDYDIYLKMSRHTRFWPINQATGLRRRHDTNISSQTGRIRMAHAMILERFINEYGGRDLLSAQQIARRLGRVYFTAGRQFFRERDYPQAVNALTRSVAHQPSLRATALLQTARALAALKTFGS